MAAKAAEAPLRRPDWLVERAAITGGSRVLADQGKLFLGRRFVRSHPVATLTRCLV